MRAYKGVPLRCVDDPIVRISLANQDTYLRQTGRAFSKSVARGPTPLALTSPTVPPKSGGGGTAGDFIDNIFAVADNLAPSKRVQFECSAISPSTTRTLTIPNASGTIALTSSIVQAFPIGSVFIAVVNTNPSSLLGYGTWSAFGAGRVLVGYDSTDTDFDNDAYPTLETGGTKTHTHSVTSNVTVAALSSTSVFSAVEDIGTVNAVTAGGTTSVSKGGHTHEVVLDHTHTVTNNAVTSGSGSSVQPYIVVYMWKRTA